MSYQIALKVDVDTLRGTLEGTPALLDLFKRLGISATLLFSLGPDHTGRAMKRVFRPGFFAKVQRTSVVEHYGIRTLLYGTLLPGPDIGVHGRAVMQRARDEGHEVGIHTWDHVLWQDYVARKDEAWTRHQMHLAYQRFEKIFGSQPVTHGAAGWQMNEAALQQLDDWHMRYASDGRVSGEEVGPYRVALQNGRKLQCVQLPTTLPTFDELIGVDDMDAMAAAKAILRSTTKPARDHVFTLHSELEGARLKPAFEALLSGWLEQGYRLGSLGDQFNKLDLGKLPWRRFGFGSIPGRSGELMLEGELLPREVPA
jgi:peptidoglycan/xylan/chitin deacetylase (PgdA/CDA1 family)